jgi:hypothetical protein
MPNRSRPGINQHIGYPICPGTGAMQKQPGAPSPGYDPGTPYPKTEYAAGTTRMNNNPPCHHGTNALGPLTDERFGWLPN